MKYILSIFFVTMLFPGLVQAEVHITEIAWMGTTNSQYSEWLELYNDANTAVNLSGWKLYENTEPIFTFTKTIAAGSYLLLERTTASAPDAVPNVSDESGSFDGGGLANTGEDLILKDDTNAVVEALYFGSGWPAGDASTKDTMQWNGSSWITAPATPKAPTSAMDQGNDAPIDGTQKKDTATKDPHPIPKVSPNQPHVDFVVPPVLYTGVPYQFEAHPVLEYNYKIEHGSFDWNMGEGTVFKQNTLLPITHTYQYPGTYTIFFRFTDPSNQYPMLKASKKVTVLAPVFTIAIVNQHILEIKNTSAVPLDLSGWAVLFPGGKAVIPDMTLVAEKGTIGIPLSVLSIGTVTSLSILDPTGTVVASTGQTRESTVPVAVQSIQSAVVDTPPIKQSIGYAAETPLEESTPSKKSPVQNRTKGIIFGAVLLFVIGLSILLERFMAQQE